MRTMAEIKQGGMVDTSRPGVINDLIAARLTGQISRRELVRRGTVLGLSASLLGVVLHATSDQAFGAPATPGPTASGGTVPIEKAIKPEGRAKQGGTLVVGSTEEPESLNPYLDPSAAALDILSGVMDGLLVYDSDQQLHPALAESFAVSDDGLTYTFTLRPDVTFHNGDPLTADDVIATWKMIIDPAFGASSQLGWEIIEEITSPTPGQVEMKTKGVYAPFLSYVAGSTFIAPAPLLEKGPDAFIRSFERKVIGTGPLRLIEWVRGDRILLERFSDYWGKTPRLDKIIYRVAPDDETHLDRLRQGQVQVAAGSGAIRAPRVDDALAIPTTTLYEHPTQTWLHLDLKQIGFLRENKVRRALDVATPTEQIINEVLKGRAIRALADQAPGSWAYDRDLKARAHDPVQASALLNDVGLAIGAEGWRARDDTVFEVELWGIAGDPMAQQVLPLIAKSWREVGVKTVTRFGEAATIWGPEGYQYTDQMTACFYGWSNANDPDDMWYWHSLSIPTSPGAPNGGNAPAFFFDYNFQAKIDDLTSRAVATLDQHERQALYVQIQELLSSEVPVIFLYWEKRFPAVAHHVGGVWPSAFNALLWNVQNWYVTEEPSA